MKKRTLFKLQLLLTLLLTLFFNNEIKAQCNTNITICTPGQAGPFSFAPASNNPTDCLDFTNGSGASRYAYIILYITQSGDLNLLINGNSNNGYIDVSIYDITGASNPCASLGTGTEIGCNYATQSSGCNEFGNNFPCPSVVPAPYVNAGDVLMILIEDWSSQHSSFTLQLSNVPGSAQTGPPDGTITPAGPFLDVDPAYSMNAADGGGTWSASCGACINPVTGAFNPAIAGVGVHEICYQIGAAPCADDDCTLVTVIANCTDPVLEPIADVNVCDGYILPPILGTDLSGNEAYFTGPGGTGTQYNIGDNYTVNGIQTLYAYSQDGVPPSICVDETSFSITVDADLPSISCPGNLTATCDISEQPAYTDFNDFIANGGAASDVTGTIDPSSFTLLSQVSDGNSCPETITRTYQIADECGHTNTCTQNIVIHDLTSPTGTAPSAVTVQCVSDVPTVNTSDVSNVSDNCTSSPSVTHVGDVSNNQTCPEIITRTYRIEDDCGNFITVDQLITINDDVDPTASAPASVHVQCIGDIPAVDINIITDAADNCTATPIVSHVSDVSDNQTCPETITRTYRIQDDCGNFIEVTQSIVVSDDINPTASNPASETVQCIGDISIPDISVVTDAADNCTVNPIVSYVTDVSDNQTCPETITRTYRVTDECGNFIEVDQLIIINDDIAPTASNPAATIVNCLSNVPPVDPEVVIDEADNCTANPLVTLESESTDNNTCNGEVITRIYKISDDCGNQSFVTHTITVDVFLPVYTLSSTDPTTCGGNDGTITLSGLNPTTDYIFSYNGNSDDTITTNGAGEYVLNGLLDGNYTSFIVRDFYCPTCLTEDNSSINLVDPTPPILIGGPNQEVCEGTSITLAAGNPGGATISWDNGVSDGVSFVPPVGTTTYTVTAELANCYSTDEVEVIVNPLPIVFAGNDFGVCEGTQVLLSGSGTSTYLWDNGVVNGQAFVQTVGTVTYTVTGTSIHGCKNTDEVEVVVHPNPVATFEVDNTEGCIPLAVQLTSTSIGNIDKCKFTLGNGTELIGCDLNHLFTSSGCHDITLLVETDQGCTHTTTEYNVVCIDDFPIANFSVEPGVVSLLEEEIEITNSTTGAVSYFWNFGDASTSYNVNPIHKYDINDKEEYMITLIAYSELGCPDTARLLLPVHEELLFYIPNTFTPDKDDYNELFQPVFTSGIDPQTYTLYIFNRWGELIFESHNTSVGWNGTYGEGSTKIVSSGTYLWKIIFKEKDKDKRHEYTGHINLLR